ncbi:MAG: YebC/PmpR family DNA-binding transcriptional regulator [Bacteroidetes bacterium 4572_77]|nr:MAG: YebC/PmpR family DNA-binding transcriptional regulator [Bacteroidetes bacterium 4572_77]
MGRAFEYRKAAKMKRWSKMSRIFPRLAKTITMAAKENGMDPDMNPALRTAIQNAKGQNMPKDNIDAAIKRAASKDVENYVETTYEGKGPHGILVFIECATNNTTRTIANIKSYFNKADGALVPTGSLEFMFSRKAIFEMPKSEDLDPEELELELIDAGLEEIEAEGEEMILTADYTSYGSMNKALEDQNMEVTKSSLQRIPTSLVEFNEEQMMDIEKFLEKVEEDDDVQQVFTNLG